MLRERFAGSSSTELAIDRVALFKQADAKARFEIIGDWQLRAALRKIWNNCENASQLDLAGTTSSGYGSLAASFKPP